MLQLLILGVAVYLLVVGIRGLMGRNQTKPPVAVATIVSAVLLIGLALIGLPMMSRL